jgi:acyl carrier protein
MTWTRESVRSEVLKVFRQHASAELSVSEESHLVADLGIDSLGVMEILADVEDSFKLTIPDEALRHVNTVGDVADAIEKRLSEDGRLEG